jgi:hypothetical protein
MSFGFMCSGESLSAIQRRPTPAEQVVIDVYRQKYEEAMGHPAHGLHYFSFPGVDLTVGVWLPIEVQASFGEPPEESAGDHVAVEG